ncbi:serine hydrolase domain-containing protein [Pseudocolwellia sp. HL-MZ19]|uniref:serine hydrolase domain-containing protein n=1 Tax=unclassified Pseudocolwellia TaxID=2848178 RepID=UPI003CEA98B9
MSKTKTAFKVLGATVGVCIVVAGALYLQDTRFWDRYYLIATNKGVLPQSGWEDSEYTVNGGQHSLLRLTKPDERTISADALTDVIDYAAARKSTSLLVWHRGKLQTREHFQDYTPESLIIGKSMAKMVVSIVIGRAIKDGYIDNLDEPASNYITEWQGTEKATITIRNMLHMAAGFEPFYTLDMSPFSNFTRSYLAGKNEGVMINGYELINEPGTVYDYSQVVSDLLGLILERATKQPYGEYLSQSLIVPLEAQGGQVMMNRPEGLAHTGCCLLLPSESWLRIGIMLANQGVVNNVSLFPDNWMKDYLEPSPANPAMGLHIWLGEPYLPTRSWTEVGTPTKFGVIHSEPYLASDLFLFDGSGNQVVYIIPSLELVIVRTGGFSWAPGKEWDNSYIPNTIIRGILEKQDTEG